MNDITERVLRVFEEINAIPRCSGNEKAISGWLTAWARDKGIDCERDEHLNVLIRVPGTAGLEGAPAVALQGHMDMVCEKSPDCAHDFTADPIRSHTDGEWLTADCTTLGADNGIAVAMALVIAGDTSIAHPPLELIFTVDEETGLTGAQNLAPGWLSSRILLNLDSEDEGIFTIGCAGGLNSLISLPLDREPVPADLVGIELVVSGLQGGHSGTDINLDRANANVLATRMLLAATADHDLRIAGFTGGSAHNAIPRDCSVVLALGAGARESVQESVKSWQDIFIAEYGSTDRNLAVTVRDADIPGQAFTPASTATFLGLLAALPHGVIRMSRDVPGLVETSTNLATVRTEDSQVTIDTSQRSSSESQLDAVAEKVRAAVTLAGGSVRVTSRYPAWEPNQESKLLATAVAAYRDKVGEDPIVEVIHAGLECGVIGAKYPGMEMLSIGPTIKDPHSPDERMNVPSLERTMDYLLHLLASLG